MSSIVCSICLEPFTEKDNACSTQCGHIYHQLCDQHWRASTNYCPVCRFPNPKSNKLFFSFEAKPKHNARQATKPAPKITINNLDDSPYVIIGGLPDALRLTDLTDFMRSLATKIGLTIQIQSLYILEGYHMVNPKVKDENTLVLCMKLAMQSMQAFKKKTKELKKWTGCSKLYVHEHPDYNQNNQSKRLVFVGMSDENRTYNFFDTIIELAGIMKVNINKSDLRCVNSLNNRNYPHIDDEMNLLVDFHSLGLANLLLSRRRHLVRLPNIFNGVTLEVFQKTVPHYDDDDDDDDDESDYVYDDTDDDDDDDDDEYDYYDGYHD